MTYKTRVPFKMDGTLLVLVGICAIICAGCATAGGPSGTRVDPAAAPSIITQPTNQTVTAGQTATFSVVANGTSPLSYQWQKNRINISGANSARYTTPPTAMADNGYSLGVIVTESTGLLTSSSATLIVNSSVSSAVITANPTSGTAVLTVGFSGTGSTDPDGTISSYAWNFGDGQTSTLPSP